jgi:LruC domain-containing protein
VDGSRIDVTFGSAVTRSSVSTRSGVSGRSASASTRADGASVPTYSPDKTAAEVKAMLANAIEFTSDTYMEAGKVYYVPAGKSVTRSTNFGVNWQEVTLIVQGTLAFDNPGGRVQAESLLKLYVLSGGKINVTDNTEFYLNCATLTNFEGGEVSGNEIGLNNNNTVNYNAGVFNVATYSANGGTLYNAESGVMTISYAALNNWGTTLVNRGSTIIGSSAYNSVFYNSCYMKFTGNFQGSITVGDNTAVTIEGEIQESWGGTITLGSNSMLVANGNANLNGKSVSGPSTGYALLRVKNLKGANGLNSNGNIYYEINSIDPDLQSSFDGWMSYVYQKLTNDNGTVSKWNESPFTLPSGDCTGEGTEPADQGTVVEDTPIKYTYVFEDNYPYVGDYDFNDLVLNVATSYDRESGTNNVQKVRLSVNLAAVGATKKIGAALRLVNINKVDIASVDFEGDTSMRSTLQNSLFEASNTESGDNSVVIPLFGDAHAVYGYTGERLILNTGVNSLNETYTMDSSIPLITKDNLDFFIGISYGSGKRAEVHLYEFLKYGATARGNIYEQNLEAAGNKTWALVAPEFKYPSEGVVITSVYPKFAEWARDHSTNQDWYEHPAW